MIAIETTIFQKGKTLKVGFTSIFASACKTILKSPAQTQTNISLHHVFVLSISVEIFKHIGKSLCDHDIIHIK